MLLNTGIRGGKLGGNFIPSIRFPTIKRVFKMTGQSARSAFDAINADTERPRSLIRVNSAS